MTQWTRRHLLAGLPLNVRAGAASTAPAAAIRGRHLHNQPADSHRHTFLVQMWQAIQAETDGKVEMRVFPLLKPRVICENVMPPKKAKQNPMTAHIIMAHISHGVSEARMRNKPIFNGPRQ